MRPGSWTPVGRSFCKLTIAQIFFLLLWSSNQLYSDTKAIDQQSGGPLLDVKPHSCPAFSQVFPLSADFLRPEVLPSAGTLAFPSKVLVTSQRTLTFTLSNPTQADATWQLVDGGSDGGASSPSDIDEGVFAVEPLRGRIEGRGVGHPKTQTVTLRFVPTESRPYTRRLILKVDKGRGGVVTLTGEGTLDERFEG